MSKLERLKDRAKALETKDPKGAIDAWLEVLKSQEEEAAANPDLGIYNRIGDLYLKLKNPAQAADYYDKAVDRYAELGFHNNAIAMCNKVLRNAPARQTAYLKLAKLYAAKGFLSEAKQNFVEYAERMQRAGKVEHAFAALKEVADLSSESEHLRAMLEEHLAAYGDVERRPSVRTAPPAGQPDKDDLGKSGKRKTSSLVFLDLDEPPSRKAGGGTARTSGPASSPSHGRPPAPPRAPEPTSLITEPEPDTSLEIERTALADDVEEGRGAGATLDGLELTSSDFGSTRAGATPRPSLRDDQTPDDDISMIADLEPTTPVDERPRPAPRAPFAPRSPAAKEAEAAKLKPPLIPKRPPPAATEPPKRKAAVEIPPLELEPDFESATSDAAHALDNEPLALDEVSDGGRAAGGRGFIDTNDASSLASGRRSAHIDLGVDGIINQGDPSGSLVFDHMEPAPEILSIEQLENRVADNPDDMAAHLALGEALIEAGDRDRGIEELDIATGGYENAGQMDQARDLVDEILRLDPNSIRHRQKAVEFAFKAGDKPKLIDAYLELADTLLRGDLPDKACAVYQRVAEHDPGNERAAAALSMLVPPAAAPTAGEGKVKAKDAKMRVRHQADVGGDFIDLGSMIMEEGEPAKDTRMKVQEEEPTGDEEQDFHDMLARFKQGIDENIDESDFQSHYDLGVAFKEMGLLDEAIAELQKALRAPEGKLRTSEALGICFFEKGAYTVAESILRRGLELPAAGDQERLGVLYWLGRALEEQGNALEARELYGRVFAVEIRFMDVGERVKALAKARR
jgi:tetratricopeptide (TPR) repeat protein